MPPGAEGQRPDRDSEEGRRQRQEVGSRPDEPDPEGREHARVSRPAERTRQAGQKCRHDARYNEDTRPRSSPPAARCRTEIRDGPLLRVRESTCDQPDRRHTASASSLSYSRQHASPSTGWAPATSLPSTSTVGDPKPRRCPGASGDDCSHSVHIEGSDRSEEHTSELQSRLHLVCRLLLEKKKNTHRTCTVRSE